MRPNSDFLSMGLQDGALIFRYFVCVYIHMCLIWAVPHKYEPTGSHVIKLIISFSCCSYNLGSGAADIIVNGTFNDGKWHRVKAVR